MRRQIASMVALVCVLLLPGTALGARAHATQGSVSGKITYVEPGLLTIQTGGRLVGVINALSATANRVGGRDYPYVYGGGHAGAGVASIGIRGPGYNGRRIGFDCSGSVAAVLAGAGLWQPGSGVPNDAGIIRQLLQAKLIARGAGTAPDEVTLYDDPGVHIFMNINGRFFGTSDGGGGDPKGGPAWLNDGAPDAWSRLYKRYHVVPSVLRNKTSYGQSYSFQAGADPAVQYGAEPGEQVKISYTETAAGSMTATAIQYAGEATVAGTVTAIAPDGSSLTLQTATGQTVALSTSLVASLISGVQVGDGVQVSYSTDPSGLLVPHALQVTNTPAPQPTGPPQNPSVGGSYGPGPYSAR